MVQDFGSSFQLLKDAKIIRKSSLEMEEAVSQANTRRKARRNRNSHCVVDGVSEA
jgi:hypothetical protein